MAGLTDREQSKIAGGVDLMPAFRGMAIGYEGRGMSMVLRPPSMPAGLRTWIVLIEEEVRVQGPTPSPPPPPDQSKLGREFLNFGLSCGSAVLAGVATAGTAGAAPLTGGASLLLTAVVWAGAAASAAQCGVSVGRLVNEFHDPGSNDRYLDSEAWYRTTSDILDAISVIGGVASLGQTAQALLRLSRTSGRPLWAILQGMERAERKRLAQDLARYTGKAPTRNQFVKLVRAGRVPKIFTQQQVTRAMTNELLNTISGSLTVASSSGFGVVRKFAVYLVGDE